MLETLHDRITRGFTVNKTRSNKIILFDLDDTLIHTTAEIMLMRNGIPIKRITNAEFNDYRLRDGESFNFSEFEDPMILARESFTRYWNTLRREYKKGTHVGILTARGSSNMVKQFLYDNGVDIKDELVMAINDAALGLSGSIQQKKAEAIGILSNAGYDTIVFFDDNEPNLKAAKMLEVPFGIKVKTVKV